MSKKQPDRGRGTKNVYDIEAQQKHLRRHLESLERDNHQPLDDVEGLVTVALAHIEDDNSGLKLKCMYAYAHGGLLMVMDTFNSRAKETKGLTSQSIFDKAKPECIDFRSSAYNFPSKQKNSRPTY